MKAISPGLAALCRTYKTESPDEAVRSAMRELLKTVKVRTPPIGLRGICRQLNVHFSWSATAHRTGTGTASLHTDGNGGFEIALHDANFRQRWRRARFSVAHELAHALIIQLIQDPILIATLDDTCERYEELERVCNAGAAELLMPSNALRQAILEFGLGPEGLGQLYDHFLVSWAALLWQIAWILPNGCCLRWRKHARHDREESVFRVVACYPGYRGQGSRAWLPNGATTSHLNSRIVEVTSFENTCVSTEGAQITLGSRSWRGNSFGTFIRRRRALNQPILSGFPVPDEAEFSSDADVILFHSRSSHFYCSQLPTLALTPAIKPERKNLVGANEIQKAHA